MENTIVYVITSCYWNIDVTGRIFSTLAKAYEAANFCWSDFDSIEECITAGEFIVVSTIVE